jgi:hypothetical protein
MSSLAVFELFGVCVVNRLKNTLAYHPNLSKEPCILASRPDRLSCLVEIKLSGWTKQELFQHWRPNPDPITYK